MGSVEVDVVLGVDELVYGWRTREVKSHSVTYGVFLELEQGACYREGVYSFACRPCHRVGGSLRSVGGNVAFGFRSVFGFAVPGASMPIGMVHECRLETNPPVPDADPQIIARPNDAMSQ